METLAAVLVEPMRSDGRAARPDLNDGSNAALKRGPFAQKPSVPILVSTKSHTSPKCLDSKTQSVDAQRHGQSLPEKAL